MHSLENDYQLLQVAQEWRKLIQWGKLQEMAGDVEKFVAAVGSYFHNMEKVFGVEHDFFHLRGQDNIMRYLPIEKMVIRLHQDDSPFETFARIAAARIAGCDTSVSVPTGLDNSLISFLKTHYGRQLLQDVPLIYESDDELAARLDEIDRVRYAGQSRVADVVFNEAAKTGFYIARAPVYMEGRIEMLQYFQQQSICNNYHRYGNLGDRSFE
jgi:RHH-type proline utilization regulon transcriptional repressor/proline dehydrogenase/delta 1-pyrroline-5-carboxylate dehydrogenase